MTSFGNVVATVDLSESIMSDDLVPVAILANYLPLLLSPELTEAATKAKFVSGAGLKFICVIEVTSALP